ncbi:MAG: hypothetical protein ABS939_15320 [Psychrobacillus sp.]
MNKKELNGQLKNYVDLLNKYEKQGQKRKAKEVEGVINYIKKQLGGM